RGIPTTNEFSQAASAPSLYFMHKTLKRDVRGTLNSFGFHWTNGLYSPNYWPLSQLLGVRYAIDRPAAQGGHSALGEHGNPGLVLRTMPYHVPKQTEPEPPGPWYVYELPNPNLGDYSPTEVITAKTGEAIANALRTAGFDFTKQVVLNSPIQTPLLPAHNIRLSFIRNGWHLSGHSDGTSLVVLPQQFSHCLKASNRQAHLVRANLLLTGVIFSGNIDTYISFNYGMFTPWCRLNDLADIKSLDLRIDLRRPHLSNERLFPHWRDALD